MQKIEELRTRLLQAGLCAADSMSGCSKADWNKVENAAGGRKLPKDYEEFMILLGRGTGEFMSDVTMFYPEVTALTKNAKELVSGAIELPDNSFVFANRRGEQLLFFRLDEHEGSKVYKWVDEDPSRFTKVFDSFSEFIFEELEAHEWQSLDENT